MKAEYINPFIESTLSVFKTMIGIEPKKNNIYIKQGDEPSFDISGVIGLAGQATGSVVISMPEDLALEVVSKFLGENKSTVDDDVIDAVGEFINMIAGSTKKVFSEKGLKFKISIPNVIVGKGHKINRPSNVPCLGVKFDVGNKFFVVEVALKEQ
ncbi:chemotaxis protein CheX [Calditerrivibrio nitroreducens]|uniref:CheC domain protein n=1 Tax=Calditerrivibrio nitroreducens (strain DSM 19672 / NBRC 101217 / Yu37-1) TaxID=768670 RepID=E4TJW9_CALNY|nr:chemotaxis protein CheX [Calditerrivibrio nitroreducens]ADR18220.1 CheC domain protein [Calditerrivibrio nitroreducens DSM 19672]